MRIDGSQDGSDTKSRDEFDSSLQVILWVEVMQTELTAFSCHLFDETTQLVVCAKKEEKATNIKFKNYLIQFGWLALCAYNGPNESYRRIVVSGYQCGSSIKWGASLSYRFSRVFTVSYERIMYHLLPSTLSSVAHRQQWQQNSIVDSKREKKRDRKRNKVNHSRKKKRISQFICTLDEEEIWIKRLLFVKV